MKNVIKTNANNSMSVVKSINYDYGYGGEMSDIHTLEMNWSKVKEHLGQSGYESLVNTAIEKWLNNHSTERIDSFLVREGFLATKRDNGLSNLLSED